MFLIGVLHLSLYVFSCLNAFLCIFMFILFLRVCVGFFCLFMVVFEHVYACSCFISFSMGSYTKL